MQHFKQVDQLVGPRRDVAPVLLFQLRRTNGQSYFRFAVGDVVFREPVQYRYGFVSCIHLLVITSSFLSSFRGDIRLEKALQKTISRDNTCKR